MNDPIIPTEAAFPPAPIEIRPGGAPLLPVRKDFAIHNLATLDQRPPRAVGAFSLDDADSLVEFINDQAAAGSRPILFANRESGTIKVVLDAPQPGFPSWMEHSAALTVKPNKWLQDWIAISGRPMGQTEFAEFIEDHLADVFQPAAADLLEIVTNLQARQKVEFKRATRLQTGDTQIVFEETTEAHAGAKGEMRVPTELVLRLPVYEQDPGNFYDFTARFRFRIAEGRLSFVIALVRPEIAMDAAFRELVNKVASEVTPAMLRIFGAIKTTPRAMIPNQL